MRINLKLKHKLIKKTQQSIFHRRIIMKKFDIKKLLVLVLALVLVFALVACNGGGSGDTDTDTDDGGSSKPKPKPTPAPTLGEGQITTADFFEKLWNGASVIGSEEIGDNDDIGLELGLSIGVTNDKNEIVDLGIDIYAILDRDTNVNTAAKVKIHDLTGSTDNNWLAIYFFLDDPYKAYVDWSYDKNQQHFQVGFDAGFNGTWASVIDGFFNDTELGGKNIDALITTFTKDMGDEWGLTGLINSVTSVFGLDLDSLIQSVVKMLGAKDANTSDGILALLKSIGGMLTGESTKNNVYPCTAEDGVYTAPLTTAWGLVGILLGDSANDIYVDANENEKYDKDTDTEFLRHEESYIGTALGGLNVKELALQYKLNSDNELDGLTIKAGIGLDDKKNGKVFDLAININSLRFHNLHTIANQAAAADVFGIDVKDYAEFFEFNLGIGATLAGDALVIGDYNFNGAYAIELKGFIDLLNHENNKTALEAVVKYNNTAIINAVYSAQSGFDKYGQIILTVNNAVKFSDGGKQSVVGALAKEVMPLAVKALIGKNVWYVDANSNDQYDIGEEKDVTEETANAVETFVYNSVALQDAGIALANALYTEEYANAAAIVAEGATFTYDTNFKGAVIQQIDLVDLFTGLFGGEPSYAAPSAAEAETVKEVSNKGTLTYKDADGNNVWIANVQKIVVAVANALSRTNDGAVVLEVKDVSEVIGAIFADNHGPTSVDEFVNGNTAKKLKGLFTAENEAWIAKTFAGSAWVEEDSSIINLFKSGVKITITDAPTIAIDVDLVGDASISINLSASIEEANAAPSYDSVTRPDGISGYFDETQGVYEVETGDNAGVWCVLSIAREVEE